MLSPYLGFSQLNVRIGLFTFPATLKMGSNRPITHCCNHFTGLLQVVGVECFLYNFRFPAALSMFLEVSGRLRVTFVQVTPDSFVTAFICTNEIVERALIIRADFGDREVECINGRCPLASQTFYESWSVTNLFNHNEAYPALPRLRSVLHPKLSHQGQQGQLPVARWGLMVSPVVCWRLHPTRHHHWETG